MSEIKHDWRAVGLDVTPYYTIAPEDKPYISRIIDVYFYDRNEHTHLCELRPSYFLRYLYTFIIWNDRDGVIPDAVQDELDNRYCHEFTEDTYMHVSDVDRMGEFVATFRDGEDATEEEVREYWQGNSPI